MPYVGRPGHRARNSPTRNSTHVVVHGPGGCGVSLVCRCGVRLTYDELVLLTKAWKMHGSLSYVVVNILIELASNSGRGLSWFWLATPPPPSVVSLRHPSMIYKAMINAGASIQRERIRPTRRDSHGGRSDEFISRACIACRHYAIDSNTYKPFTHQEARGIEAPFKGLRVHSTHKGEETGGNPLSREETTLLSMCAPHLRPLIALSQRFRSCTGTSV